MPIWASHWNPRYDVIGGAAWANPFQIDTYLENSVDLNGRIAIVGRGLIPFVEKVKIVQVFN